MKLALPTGKEIDMKKAYTTPAQVVVHEIIKETNAQGPGTVEFGQFKRPVSGSVGFHV